MPPPPRPPWLWPVVVPTQVTALPVLLTPMKRRRVDGSVGVQGLYFQHLLPRTIAEDENGVKKKSCLLEGKELAQGSPWSVLFLDERP